MFLKDSVMLLSLFMVCDSVHVYSSFWAPLFDPRILNYRVDIPFDPETGKSARDQYMSKYGVRGENLIANLGNGKGIKSDTYDNKGNTDLKFYYTYPGAQQNEEYLNK